MLSIFILRYFLWYFVHVKFCGWEVLCYFVHIVIHRKDRNPRNIIICAKINTPKVCFKKYFSNHMRGISWNVTLLLTPWKNFCISIILLSSLKDVWFLCKCSATSTILNDLFSLFSKLFWLKYVSIMLAYVLHISGKNLDNHGKNNKFRTCYVRSTKR